ncbi:unnamed protein product [Pylaiella littoralis]
MLRYRGQPRAFRCLVRVLDPTARQVWQPISTSNAAKGVDDERHKAAAPAAYYRRIRRSRATAGNKHDGISGDLQGNHIPAAKVTSAAAAAPAPPALVKRAAGGEGPELRAWQLAMLELARRHSVLLTSRNSSKDPNKVSQWTVEYIPKVLEAWRKVVDGECGRKMWFRGAAKFYAPLLGGVWPKMANHFLADIIRACNGNDGNGAAVEAGREASSSRSICLRSLATTLTLAVSEFSSESTSTAAAAAAAAAAASAANIAGAGVGVSVGVGVDKPHDEQLNWRRTLEILKEARLAGVEIHPDLMVLVLSKAPVGNSRKVSHLVSAQGSKIYGFLATPDMLAAAAVAHWREGVVVGAARHLDSMEAKVKSVAKKQKAASPTSPLVQEWLAADVKVLRAVAEAAASGSASRHPADARQWPWRLVVVDIYGRASRWKEAAETFDAFLGEMTFLSAPGVERLTGSSSSSRHQRDRGAEVGVQKAQARARKTTCVRLPMPDDFDSDGSGIGTSGGRYDGDDRSETARGMSVLPLAGWVCFHPSALMHAATAYLKLGRVEEAAEVLSYLKASVSPSVVSAAAGAGRKSDVGTSRHGGRGSGGIEDDGRRRGDVTSSDLPAAVVCPPDPAWIKGAVRGFARFGRWDLAREVLSAEIWNWLSLEMETTSKQSGSGSGSGGGSGGGGGGSGGGLAPVVESLEAFLESKLEAKRQTPEQTAGSRACLELLKSIRASGLLGGGEGTDSPAAAINEEGKKVASRGGVRGRGHDQPEPSSGAELLRKPAGTYTMSVDQGQDRHRHRQASSLAYTEALRWLLPGEFGGPDGEVTAAPGAGSSGEGPSPSHRPHASEGKSLSSSSKDCRSLLLSRCKNVSQEAVVQAIHRAWSPDGHRRESEEEEEKEGADDDATKERRRDAAFALYEAGVESNAIPADAHWVSRSAGVLNLDCVDYQMHHGVPLAALNLVLNDMRQKYAYEESVGRHVHQPYADLIMIASIKGSPRALDTVREVLWLLGSSRFDESLEGGLELIGRVGWGPKATPDAAAAAAAPMRQNERKDETATKPERRLLCEVQETVLRSPSRGVVLSLPRRALQGWLLAEGRARNKGGGSGGGGGGGGGGGLWTPSWVEDGIDVVPPGLPGLGTVGSLRADGANGVGVGVGGGDDGSERSPFDAGTFSPSSLQEATPE